ncbi:hypothetical protein NL676_022881 [Syzygium grande]|nr:hypothetical protein NL676_022881 [Syzygium grande]
MLDVIGLDEVGGGDSSIWVGFNGPLPRMLDVIGLDEVGNGDGSVRRIALQQFHWLVVAPLAIGSPVLENELYSSSSVTTCGGSESKNTMLDHLLSLQESQPEYYTDQIIKGLILVMILAGTDTSAVTLEWAMSELINHPYALKKVAQELDNVIGKQHCDYIQRLHFLHHTCPPRIAP